MCSPRSSEKRGPILLLLLLVLIIQPDVAAWGSACSCCPAVWPSVVFTFATILEVCNFTLIVLRRTAGQVRNSSRCLLCCVPRSLFGRSLPFTMSCATTKHLMLRRFRTKNDRLREEKHVHERKKLLGSALIDDSDHYSITTRRPSVTICLKSRDLEAPQHKQTGSQTLKDYILRTFHRGFLFLGRKFRLFDSGHPWGHAAIYLAHFFVADEP